MSHFEKPEFQETPEGRLSVVARHAVEWKHKIINEHRAMELRTVYPDVPTISDFLEYMGPSVTQELVIAGLSARLEEIKTTVSQGAHLKGRELYLLARAIELQRQLDEAKRKKADRHST